jgi:hypothetical protein
MNSLTSRDARRRSQSPHHQGVGLPCWLDADETTATLSRLCCGKGHKKDNLDTPARYERNRFRGVFVVHVVHALMNRACQNHLAFF